MYKIERFGTSYFLPHVNPVQDQSAGPARLQLYDIPGGGAFDGLGSDPAYPGARTITKSCAIIEYNETTLLTAVRELRGKLGLRDRLYRRTYATDEVEWVDARLESIASVRNPEGFAKYRANFDLTFQVISPVWNGSQHGPGWTFDSGEYLDTSLTFDEAQNSLILLDNTTVTGTINNGGNAAVRNPVLIISPGTQRISSLTIKRIVSGVTYEHLVLAIDIPIDCALWLDCGAFTVTVEAPDWTALAFYDTHHGVRGLATDGEYHYYRVTTPGDAGSSAPTWPTTGTVVDGTVTWTHVGKADQYANFSLGSEHRSDVWLQLLAGDNSFTFVRTGGSTGAQATFQFYDGWH